MRQAAGDSPLLGAFSAALDDDLNISGAWGAIFEWVRDTNRKLADNALDAAAAAAALATWEKAGFGAGRRRAEGGGSAAEITALIEARAGRPQSEGFQTRRRSPRRAEGQGLGHRGHPQGRARQALVT